MYEAYYTTRGIPYKGTDFSGRSDYGPFIAQVDIPAGGLFTGAEGIKTAEEAAIWGGIAGAQYDPCYHLACDTFAGTGNGAGSTAPGRGLIALEVNSDLIAYAQLTFAFSTRDRQRRARQARFRARALRSRRQVTSREAGRHSGLPLLHSLANGREFPYVPRSSTVHPDYELDDVLVVQDPKQLRALGDFTRGRIVGLLGQRAASTTELAAALDMPKGTVGHHLKVLEKAGLVRVVRTRQVRALTEKYYGRVARLFELKGVDDARRISAPARISAMMLRQVAEEAAASGIDEKGRTGVGRARLTKKDAARFERRLARLAGRLSRCRGPGRRAARALGRALPLGDHAAAVDADA